MTEPIAVPINIFENERELMVVAPMPGVSPEDIEVDVLEDGRMALRAAPRGEGQDRIAHLVREWAYGPYHREFELPVPVDGQRANVTLDNGVLTVTLPKASATMATTLRLGRTGHARGVASGHTGTRGGAASA
ncbi:MAG: hypothetical protein DLM71_08125 [Chloroflexi bacterium]|nr:MAG: hypothetical protein DLM71_08125 [Chloroflexota bacterium]